MSAASDFGAVPPFETIVPAEYRIPFVFNSPHSGSIYPARFRAMSRLDAHAIRRSEDCFVDELFAGAVALGAPLLRAHFPRAYLDVNREPFELDPAMFREPLPAHVNSRSARVAGGLGTIPRLVGEGLEIYAAKLAFSEALDRIERIYNPYHSCLRRLLAATHARFGHSVLIDCHSMPASIRVADGAVRPDFIIGDRFGVACARKLSEAAIVILTDLGYTVAHNKPYAGGFITEHYGRPTRGLHALQIEINRGLYMDERTLTRTAGFDALADDLTTFCRMLTGADAIMDDLPIAAE